MGFIFWKGTGSYRPSLSPSRIKKSRSILLHSSPVHCGDPLLLLLARTSSLINSGFKMAPFPDLPPSPTSCVFVGASMSKRASTANPKTYVLVWRWVRERELHSPFGLLRESGRKKDASSWQGTGQGHFMALWNGLFPDFPLWQETTLSLSLSCNNIPEKTTPLRRFPRGVTGSERLLVLIVVGLLVLY